MTERERSLPFAMSQTAHPDTAKNHQDTANLNDAKARNLIDEAPVAA
jgi:hypothetical protein